MDYNLMLKTNVGDYEVSTIGEVRLPRIVRRFLRRLSRKRDDRPRMRRSHPRYVALGWAFFHKRLSLIPLYYETMVFSSSGEVMDQARYRSRSKAVYGHLKMMAKWREVANGDRSVT